AGGSLSKQDWTIQWPSAEPGKENSPGCQPEAGQWGRTHLSPSPKVPAKCGQHHCHAGSSHGPMYTHVERLTVEGHPGLCPPVESGHRSLPPSPRQRHAAHTPPRTPNIVTTVTPPGTPPLRRRNKLKPPGTPPPSSRKLIHLIPGFTALHRSKSHEFQLGHRVDEAHTPKVKKKTKPLNLKIHSSVGSCENIPAQRSPLLSERSLRSFFVGYPPFLPSTPPVHNEATFSASIQTCMSARPSPKPTNSTRTWLPASKLARPWQMNLRTKGWVQLCTCCVSPKKIHSTGSRVLSAILFLSVCLEKALRRSVDEALPGASFAKLSHIYMKLLLVTQDPRCWSTLGWQQLALLSLLPLFSSSLCPAGPHPGALPARLQQQPLLHHLVHSLVASAAAAAQRHAPVPAAPLPAVPASAETVQPASFFVLPSFPPSQNEEGTEEAQESEDDFEEMNLSLLSARNFPRKASQTSIFLQEWDIPFEQLEMGELIGKGRFGQVFHGRWHGEVAIRLIDIERDNEEQLKAFKREVMAYRQTRHENVVLFMGACMSPPHLAIITSLCKGRTLYSVVRDAKIVLDVNKTRQIAQEIVKGMGYLHAKGILHKDLKSKNVFYDNGKVVITDFGLFSISGVLQAGRRENKLRIQSGWLCHLAPEIIRQLSPDTEEDKLPFSKHSDVFALGTIWYELHAREWPFKTQPAEAIIWQVGRGMKPNLSQIGMGKEISDILLFCWAYEQEERPTFTKLMDMLEKLPKRNRRLSHPGHFWKSAE
ncbi:KSR2 Kinase, partial [Bucco capensis]|nr:KSR2 Kinase [Bucco capensis]